MESVDSSPNYSRPRSRFDANKENSPRGSDYDEITSTYGSPLNKPYTRKPSINGIKHRTSNKKNFATLRSFRRRPKPRPIQPISDSDESLLDSSESSPHYLKATTSSKGKKSTHSESTLDGSDKNSTNSSKLALSRTSSFRSVRILIKRGSFKPKRSLLRHSEVSEDVHVDRATYSSTLKDSKFPLPVEVLQESEKSPAVRVCRYHHCSLHGGCHGGEDPAPLPKRFLYKRKQSMRRQRGMVRKAETRHGAKVSSDRKRVESLNNRERLSDKVSVSGVENEIGNEGKYPNEETEIFGDGCEDDRESHLIELVFGETSFPERSYEDSLQIRRKYTLEEQNGYCSTCSCHKREDQEVATTPKRVEAASSSLEGTENEKEIPQNESHDLSMSPSSLSPFEKAKESDDSSAAFDEISEKRSESSSSASSSSQTSTDSTNTEEDADSITESSPPEDSKAARTEDSETKSSLHFSKPRHMSMWYMIHQHMSSNVAVESANKPVQEDKDVAPLSNELSEADVGMENNNETETQEIELRKLFAVKLVREAIERILLPEVQDQSSDDQSTPRACNDAESNAERVNDNVSSNMIEEKVENGDASGKEMKESEEKVERKSEKKAAPKHWSNLKKWILLQRFIRELEKVKRFNPKKPRILPLNPDPEAEKVSLRPQTVEERKSAEEWMLDHALRQAVSQLAPTQKKKVALLVKAFETVVPPQESSDQAQTRRLVGSSSVVANTISIFGSPISKARSLNLDGNGNVMENEADTEDTKAKTEDVKAKTESKNHIKMWHMIYQHVVSNIAEKVGGQLLEGGEGEEEEEEGLTKSDALKLVKEAVDEILVPETQDDVGGENAAKEESKAESKSKNWSKLKKIILLKRSIKALEKARKLRAQPHQVLPRSSDLEPEKVDLRQKAMDERKKAEQWMLDYAVQHIVTTLTPARKRRVSMLVEAFEAVVPLPEA